MFKKEENKQVEEQKVAFVVRDDRVFKSLVINGEMYTFYGTKEEIETKFIELEKFIKDNKKKEKKIEDTDLDFCFIDENNKKLNGIFNDVNFYESVDNNPNKKKIEEILKTTDIKSKIERNKEKNGNEKINLLSVNVEKFPSNLDDKTNERVSFVDVKNKKILINKEYFERRLKYFDKDPLKQEQFILNFFCGYNLNGEKLITGYDKSKKSFILNEKLNFSIENTTEKELNLRFKNYSNEKKMDSKKKNLNQGISLLECIESNDKFKLSDLNKINHRNNNHYKNYKGQII